MADDLVGLFSDIPLETMWLVCQRCLHGGAAWHLRCYISHCDLDDNPDMRELKRRIINYYPNADQPPPGRAPRMPHRLELPGLVARLRYFLAQEVSDDDAELWRLDHINPPGFECLGDNIF